MVSKKSLALVRWICFFLFIFLFTMLFVVDYVVWLVQGGIVPFKFLMWSVVFYMPFYLFAVVILMPETSERAKWKLIFDYRLWLIPLLCFIGFCLYNELVGTDSPAGWNSTADVLGYAWNWQAILSWLILFMVLLVLSQRWKKMDRAYSFTLSLMSLPSAAVLYELPWHLSSTNAMLQLYDMKWIAASLLVVYVLFQYGWKPNKLFGVGLGFLVVEWFLLNKPLPFVWIYLGQYPLERFLVYPLYVSFVSGIPKEIVRRVRAGV